MSRETKGPIEEHERRAREELDRRREAAQLRQSQISESDREKLRQLHWMRCPKCGCELSEVQFRSVKVDKCLTCGGVYLDDGELEQLTGKPGWFDSMLQFFQAS